MNAPFKILRNLTLGEVEAMPEPQRTETRKAITEMVLRDMRARDERYLDGEYDRVGDLRRYEIGE